MPVRALLGLGLVLGLGTTGTYAYWTDSVPVTGTTISTGTIDLRVDGADAVAGWATMSLAGMVPGNSTAATLTVTNSGTAPVHYWADASAGNADGKGLGAALVVKVTGDAGTSGAAPATTCAGAALAGTGTSFGVDLVGSAASPRLLAPGASETLCVQATLPTDASSALQGASTDVAFTFEGTSF